MKKYAALIGAVGMTVCLGGLYAWSVFVPSLRETFGYTAAQTQTVFGHSFIVFTVAQVFTGRLTDRLNPRWMALFSGGLLSAAWLTAGYGGETFPWLWLGVSSTGLAVAFGYVCPMATAVKWFPDHKGLVCGLAVAGYGGGAILLARVGAILLDHGWAVLDIFKLVGFVYGPTVALAGLLLFVPQHAETARTQVAEFKRRTLLGDPWFWMLGVVMFCGTLPGIVIVGDLKPIGLWLGVAGAAAGWAVSAFAFGSAAGRIGWGVIQDRLGPRASTLLALGMIALSIVLLVTVGGLSGAAFIAMACLAGFCYGGNFALYPAQTAAVYGMAVMGTVYTLVMVFHGLAGLVGPSIVGFARDKTGSYLPGLGLAFFLAVGGLLAFSLFTRSKRFRDFNASMTDR